MEVQRILDEAVREAGDRIRAALAMRFRDLDLAEEAFAFASLRAVETWEQNGPPRDPAAWLYAVGRRRAFDLGRRAPGANLSRQPESGGALDTRKSCASLRARKGILEGVAA